jgi:uncharacterized membrane protein
MLSSLAYCMVIALLLPCYKFSYWHVDVSSCRVNILIAVVSLVFSIARDTKMQQEREKNKKDGDGRAGSHYNYCFRSVCTPVAFSMFCEMFFQGIELIYIYRVALFIT